MVCIYLRDDKKQLGMFLAHFNESCAEIENFLGFYQQPGEVINKEYVISFVLFLCIWHLAEMGTIYILIVTPVIKIRDIYVHCTQGILQVQNGVIISNKLLIYGI